MVAEETEDAEYKNRRGAYRCREDPSSEEAGPVAELTRLPPGYPALLEELKNPDPGCPTTGRPDAQPGDHPALLVYRTGPLLPLCGRGVGN
jgi:hypothetical protein